MSRRAAINAFIAAVLVLFALDALPACCGLHRWIQQVIAPPLTAIGLDQDWQLYAPKPYSVNSRLAIHVEFADGPGTTWTSPDWTEVSQVGRFVGTRQLNLWGYVTNDECSAAWPSIADHHARKAGKPVRLVTMMRIIRRTPPPGQPPSPASVEIFYTRGYP